MTLAPTFNVADSLDHVLLYNAYEYQRNNQSEGIKSRLKRNFSDAISLIKTKLTKDQVIDELVEASNPATQQERRFFRYSVVSEAISEVMRIGIAAKTYMETGSPLAAIVARNHLSFITHIPSAALGYAMLKEEGESNVEFAERYGVFKGLDSLLIGRPIGMMTEAATLATYFALRTQDVPEDTAMMASIYAFYPAVNILRYALASRHIYRKVSEGVLDKEPDYGQANRAIILEAVRRQHETQFMMLRPMLM